MGFLERVHTDRCVRMYSEIRYFLESSKRLITKVKLIN